MNDLSIKNILSTGQDKAEPEQPITEHTYNSYGLTRGASYYGGKNE